MLVARNSNSDSEADSPNSAKAFFAITCDTGTTTSPITMANAR